MKNSSLNQEKIIRKTKLAEIGSAVCIRNMESQYNIRPSKAVLEDLKKDV
jgi:hypothetical protein